MKHRVTIGEPFPLERGGTLADVEVEVRTWGRHRGNATLVCHALTGDADADVWWADLFTRGSLLDPAERFVVAMNVLGGCGGTTGPTTRMSNGERIGRGFPAITIRDMVRLQRAVLAQLGVHRLELVIGGSMGGMQVLEWALMYPTLVDAIVPIAVGSSQSAWAMALSDAQRHAITADPVWDNGRYPEDASVPGLATARMIAMCSYRSRESFDVRFGRSSDDDGFVVQSYLRNHGSRLVDRFDANTYLTLVDAMDSHDLGRGRGPVEAILRRITARTLVVGISTDVLYPVAEVRKLAQAIPRARFAVLDSPHGHDAFLIDTNQIDRIVNGFLVEDAGADREPGRGASWA